MSRGAGSTAVLWRETYRTARRWQTYATRAGFSAALLAILLFGIWASMQATSTGWAKASESAWMGRGLFVLFTVLQMLIALFMAPMTTARAIIEERLEGTLDLLVLTPLQSGDLMLSKYASRIAQLITVVLGSVPFLALATALGGVSVLEVVLVSLGNVVMLVMMGALGAFFALFTRSAIVATLAASGWALLAFLLLPPIHALLVADWSGTAHISPFFASAGNLWGLVLPLVWLPSLVLIAHLSTRLFELRVAQAELRRFFDGETWSVRTAMVLTGVLGVAMITLLPAGLIGTWSTMSSTSSTSVAIAATSTVAVLLVTSLVGLLGTWFYLRLAMDLVDALEGMLDSAGSDRSRAKKGSERRIGRNPIVWRESRVSAWGRGGLPLMIGWGLLLFAVLQTGLWLIPGGLLLLGAINAAAAILLTAWLAAGSIEQERHGHTLDMLKITLLPGSAVIGGKLRALSVPTLVPVVLTVPFLMLGFPHAGLLMIGSSRGGLDDLVVSLGRGALTGGWLVAFWLFVALLSMTIALRTRIPSTAYGASIGAIAVLVLVPTFMAQVLGSWWWAALPFRLIMPATLLNATYVELVLGSLWLIGASVVLHVMLVRNVRTWGEDR